MTPRRRVAVFLAIALILSALVFPDTAGAHNVSKRDASFVASNHGAAIPAFLYLGAKHMVTGYDHIAFLIGVVFFLYRLKDIVLYVSLFTLGHSITLLGGVLGGIHANPYAIDAIIGLSVVYKAFDNMDGFRRFFGFEPRARVPARSPRRHFELTMLIISRPSTQSLGAWWSRPNPWNRPKTTPAPRAWCWVQIPQETPEAVHVVERFLYHRQPHDRIDRGAANPPAHRPAK